MKTCFYFAAAPKFELLDWTETRIGLDCLGMNTLHVYTMTTENDFNVFKWAIPSPCILEHLIPFFKTSTVLLQCFIVQRYGPYAIDIFCGSVLIDVIPRASGIIASKSICPLMRLCKTCHSATAARVAQDSSPPRKHNISGLILTKTV